LPLDEVAGEWLPRRKALAEPEPSKGVHGRAGEVPRRKLYGVEDEQRDQHVARALGEWRELEPAGRGVALAAVHPDPISRCWGCPPLRRASAPEPTARRSGHIGP